MAFRLVHQISSNVNKPIFLGSSSTECIRRFRSLSPIFSSVDDHYRPVYTEYDLEYTSRRRSHSQPCRHLFCFSNSKRCASTDKQSDNQDEEYYYDHEDGTETDSYDYKPSSSYQRKSRTAKTKPLTPRKSRGGSARPQFSFRPFSEEYPVEEIPKARPKDVASVSKASRKTAEYHLRDSRPEHKKNAFNIFQYYSDQYKWKDKKVLPHLQPHNLKPYGTGENLVFPIYNNNRHRSINYPITEPGYTEQFINTYQKKTPIFNNPKESSSSTSQEREYSTGSTSKKNITNAQSSDVKGSAVVPETGNFVNKSNRLLEKTMKLIPDIHSLRQKQTQSPMDSSKPVVKTPSISKDLQMCNQVISEYKKLDPNYSSSKKSIISGSSEEKEAVNRAINFATNYRRYYENKYKFNKFSHKQATLPLKGNAISDIQVRDHHKAKGALDDATNPPKAEETKPAEVVNQVEQKREQPQRKKYSFDGNPLSFPEVPVTPIKIRVGPKANLLQSNLPPEAVNFSDKIRLEKNERLVSPWPSYAETVKDVKPSKSNNLDIKYPPSVVTTKAEKDTTNYNVQTNCPQPKSGYCTDTRSLHRNVEPMESALNRCDGYTRSYRNNNMFPDNFGRTFYTGQRQYSTSYKGMVYHKETVARKRSNQTNHNCDSTKSVVPYIYRDLSLSQESYISQIYNGIRFLIKNFQRFCFYPHVHTFFNTDSIFSKSNRNKAYVFSHLKDEIEKVISSNLASKKLTINEILCSEHYFNPKYLTNPAVDQKENSNFCTPFKEISKCNKKCSNVNVSITCELPKSKATSKVLQRGGFGLSSLRGNLASEKSLSLHYFAIRNYSQEAKKGDKDNDYPMKKYSHTNPDCCCVVVSPCPEEDKTPPLKRLPKFKKEDRNWAEYKKCSSVIVCERADDNLKPKEKCLPKLSPGTCPCVEKVYEDVPQPKLKRLPKFKKVDVKCPPKPPPCRIPRADDNWELKKKPLPKLVAGDCPCMEQKHLEDVEPLKRLPKAPKEDVDWTTKKRCIKTYKCIRADDNLKIEHKELPKLKPGACPCIEEKAPSEDCTPELKRLPKFDKTDFKYKPPIKPCALIPRADDNLDLKPQPLPKLESGKCPCVDLTASIVDVPPLKRLPKFDKPDHKWERGCIPPVCDPRADDGYEPDQKPLPKLKPGSCPCIEKEVEGRYAPTLKRLPKIEIKDARKVVIKKICEIPRADDALKEKIKNLPKLIPGDCPCIDQSPPEDAEPLKRLPKAPKEEVDWTTKKGCIKTYECIRADDNLRVEHKELPKLKPGTCPCIEEKASEDCTPELKRLPKFDKTDFKCKPPIKPCALIPRADDNLELKPKPLPKLESGKCPCVDLTASIVDVPPLKRLPKFDKPDRKWEKGCIPPVCDPRADDGYEPEKKPLPKLKPGNCPCIEKEFEGRYAPTLKRLPKIEIKDARKVVIKKICEIPRADDALKEKIKNLPKLIPGDCPCIDQSPPEDAEPLKRLPKAPKEDVDWTTKKRCIKTYECIRADDNLKIEHKELPKLKPGTCPCIEEKSPSEDYTPELKRLPKFDKTDFKCKPPIKPCALIPRADDNLDLKPQPLPKLELGKCPCVDLTASIVDVPPLKRLPRFEKPDHKWEKRCIPPVCDARADDGYEPEQKPLPKLKPGNCPCIDKEVEERYAPTLKRLPKIEIKDTRKVIIKKICEIPRADDALKEEVKCLPKLLAGDCPCIDYKNQLEDVPPLKRLPKFKVEDPVRQEKGCKQIVTCTRADDNLKPECKSLPVLLPSRCPCVEKENTCVDVPPLKRLPKYKIVEERKCPKVQTICSERSDDLLGYKVMRKKLVPILTRTSKECYHTLPSDPVHCRPTYPTLYKCVYRLGIRHLNQQGKNKSKSSCKIESSKTPKTKKTCPRFKLKNCKPPDPAYKSCRREYIIKPCTKKSSPYPSFSECDPSIEKTVCECVDNETKILQPKYPILNPIGVLKAPPPDQGHIDMRKEKDCIMKKLGLKNEGVTKTCETFNLPEPEFDGKKLLALAEQEAEETAKEQGTSLENMRKEALDAACCENKSKPGEKNECPIVDIKTCNIGEPKLSLPDKSKSKQECETKAVVNESCNKKSLTPCTTKKKSSTTACVSKTPSTPLKKKDSACGKKSAEKKGLWQKILDFFKARPNCPEPGDWKKKQLKEDAEKAAKAAGMKLCKPCKPNPCKKKGPTLKCNSKAKQTPVKKKEKKVESAPKKSTDKKTVTKKENKTEVKCKKYKDETKGNKEMENKAETKCKKDGDQQKDLCAKFRTSKESICSRIAKKKKEAGSQKESKKAGYQPAKVTVCDSTAKPPKKKEDKDTSICKRFKSKKDQTKQGDSCKQAKSKTETSKKTDSSCKVSKSKENVPKLQKTDKKEDTCKKSAPKTKTSKQAPPCKSGEKNSNKSAKSSKFSDFCKNIRSKKGIKKSASSSNCNAPKSNTKKPTCKPAKPKKQQSCKKAAKKDLCGKKKEENKFANAFPPDMPFCELPRRKKGSKRSKRKCKSAPALTPMDDCIRKIRALKRQANDESEAEWETLSEEECASEEPKEECKPKPIFKACSSKPKPSKDCKPKPVTKCTKKPKPNLALPKCKPKPPSSICQSKSVPQTKCKPKPPKVCTSDSKTKPAKSEPKANCTQKSSTNELKCGKDKQSGSSTLKGKCKKIKSNCPPRVRESCEKEYKTVPCKSAPTPYKSFSECHPPFPKIKENECVVARDKAKKTLSRINFKVANNDDDNKCGSTSSRSYSTFSIFSRHRLFHSTSQSCRYYSSEKSRGSKRFSVDDSKKSTAKANASSKNLSRHLLAVIEEGIQMLESQDLDLFSQPGRKGLKSLQQLSDSEVDDFFAQESEFNPFQALRSDARETVSYACKLNPLAESLPFLNVDHNSEQYFEQLPDVAAQLEENRFIGAFKSLCNPIYEDSNESELSSAECENANADSKEQEQDDDTPLKNKDRQ